MAAEVFPQGPIEALVSADHSLDMSVEVTVGVTAADEHRAPRAATFATTALPDGTQELTAEVDVELSPDAIGEWGGSAAAGRWCRPCLCRWDCHPRGGCSAAGTDRESQDLCGSRSHLRTSVVSCEICLLLLQPALGFWTLRFCQRQGLKAASWLQHLPVTWAAVMVCHDLSS